MASEKAQHPWSRAEHDGEDTSVSDNASSIGVRSVDERPPAYVGSSEIAESSTAHATIPPPLVEGDQKRPLQQEEQQQHQQEEQQQQQQQQQQNISRKPVAIPAVNTSFDSPFLRAYAPVLGEHKLPKEVFLSFLDRLNKAVANSPPLEVLDVTGGLLSSVPILFPLHWIGSAVSGIANLGNMGISKSRTDSLVRDANRNIFGPRGLKIEIAKLDALAHIAKIPILDSQGKVSRQSALFQQLTRLGPSGASIGPDDGYDFSDTQQKRIQILQPWIAELELDILPWTSKSKLTRFNAALKKHNDPSNPQARQGRNNYQQGPVNADYSKGEDDDPFRKCLWLIIRDLDGKTEVRQ